MISVLLQAYDQVEHIKAQLLQERELRSVTESCLMEDRAAWQQVRRVATETHQCLVEVQDTTNVIRYVYFRVPSHSGNQGTP